MPVQSIGPPASRSNTKDMLDTDDAIVTSLAPSSRDTGTAPFDKDDAAGNDHDADNDIVRSFDRVSYTYSFDVNARDEANAYRRARIGFRFTLNQPADKVSFDLDSMGWVDTSTGYKPELSTETIEGQPAQVLTVYRLLTPTQDSPTVIPGKSRVSLVLWVRNMANGSKFAPKVEAWGAPDASTMTDPASFTSDPVTVSAKLNLNLRITGGASDASSNQDFDFRTPEAQNYINHQLGKRKGIISKFNWAVDMRWPDRTKGLKGLEVPAGPITFSFSLSNAWQNKDGNPHDQKAELQPYFWDIGTIDGGFTNSGRNTADQGWNPRLNNYDYARATGGHAGVDRVQGNGKYSLDEQQRDEQGLKVKLTLKGYQANDPFPKLGHTYAPNVECTPILASTNCKRAEVGEISAGYLYVFNPSTIENKDVADYYGQTGLSLHATINDGGLEATSASGTKLPSASSVMGADNQTVQTDDERKDVVFTQDHAKPSSIRNIIQYSCLYEPNYFDDGVDCGWWNAPDTLRGTDSAMAGTQVRVMAGFKFTTSKDELPLLGLTLVKIDPSVIKLPDPGELNLPWDGNGLWQDASNDVKGGSKSPTMVKYAAKPDGSTWKNDDEQAKADIKDLSFYDTPKAAQEQGKTVVGILLGARTAASDVFANSDNAHYGFGGFLVNVRADAPVGSVAQLTSVSRAFSRDQLADKAHLDANNSSNQDWENWAEAQDPYKLFQETTPHFQTAMNGYKKASYDQTTGYKGDDTGGNEQGDSLYVGGQTNYISNTTAQGSDTNRKKNFDIDDDQRYADWKLSVNMVPSTAEAAKDGTTELYITDQLPAKLHYIPGSAYLGGTYTEGTPEMGHVDQGESLEPNVVTNEQGKTTLSWTLTNIKVNDSGPHVIYFSTYIGDTTDPSKDINSGPDGEDLETLASVKSKNNMSLPKINRRPEVNPTLRTTSSFKIHPLKINPTSMSTSALQTINDSGKPIGFTNMLSSAAGSGKERHYAIDIMPYNQRAVDNPNLQGSTLTDMSVKAAGSDLSGLTIKFTLDEQWRTRDTRSIKSADYQSWEPATLNQETGKVTMPKNAVAWVFIVSNQSGKFRYDITFHIDPGDNGPGDLYLNRWGNSLNQVSAQARVAQRSVSGMVWYDKNGDGICSEDDPRLKDVKVTLLDTQNNPVNSVVSPYKKLTTETDGEGKYTLTNMPAGHFRLRFEPASGTDWTHLTTTIPGADKASPSMNSSASNLVDGGKLVGAYIDKINFAEAEEMVAASQSLDYNNCGLTGTMDTDEASAGVKVQIKGRNWLRTDSFTLTVEPLSGAPSAALPSQIIINADNQDTQVPINTHALLSDGSYKYRVHQEAGSIPGLTYGQNNAILTITLKSDVNRLRRTAKAEWADDDGNKIGKALFTNAYKAQPTQVRLTAFKRMDGRSLKDGEFSFRLYDKDGNQLDEAANKADGKIEFTPQTLSKPGDYAYSVREVQGSLDGIAYDQSTAQIAVHVSDDLNGQLQAAIQGNNPTFTNAYKAQPDNPDNPGNSGEHDEANPPAEPSNPGQTDSDGQKTASGNRPSDGQAKSSTGSAALAASGSDVVMPVALTVGTVILGLALTCLLRRRRNQDIDLGR